MRDLVGIKLLMKARRDKGDGTSLPSLARLKPKSQRQLLVVLGIPLAALFLYFYAIGRDRYFVRSEVVVRKANNLSLIHISEPTRPERISYAVFCLKKNFALRLLTTRRARGYVCPLHRNRIERC